MEICNPTDDASSVWASSASDRMLRFQLTYPVAAAESKRARKPMLSEVIGKFTKPRDLSPYLARVK